MTAESYWATPPRSRRSSTASYSRARPQIRTTQPVSRRQPGHDARLEYPVMGYSIKLAALMKPLHASLRGYAASLFVLLLASANPATQVKNSVVREQGVSLSALIGVRGNVYAADHNATVLYPGEG